MKTYNDLSDEQLSELASLAAGVNAPAKWNRLDDENIYSKLYSGDLTVAFWCDDGTITIRGYGGNIIIRNIWSIVAKCLEWGVDYRPKQETA